MLTDATSLGKVSVIGLPRSGVLMVVISVLALSSRDTPSCYSFVAIATFVISACSQRLGISLVLYKTSASARIIRLRRRTEEWRSDFVCFLRHKNMEHCLENSEASEDL